MPAGQTGEQAESVSFSGGEVEFYTAQSLLPRYDRDLADQYDLVIYDEVHHYSNLDGYGAAIDRPNYRAAMGLSATIGDDGELKREQLTELLGDVVHTYGLRTLVVTGSYLNLTGRYTDAARSLRTGRMG